MQKNYLVQFCSLFMFFVLPACFATELPLEQGIASSVETKKNVVTESDQKCVKVQVQTTPNDVDTLIYRGENSGRICQQFQKTDDDASLLTAFISAGTYRLDVWKDGVCEGGVVLKDGVCKGGVLKDYETNCRIEVKESEQPDVLVTDIKCSEQEDSVRIALFNNANTDKKDNSFSADNTDKNNPVSSEYSEHQKRSSENVKDATDKKGHFPKKSHMPSKSQHFTFEMSHLKRGNSYTVSIYKSGSVKLTKGQKKRCFKKMPQKDVVRLDNRDCSFESQDDFTLSISHLKRGNSYTVQIYKSGYVGTKKGKIFTCYRKMPKKNVVRLDSSDCSFGPDCSLSRHDGIIEVSINYQGQQHTLKFVEVAAKVDIALRKADAQRFYRKAQQMWQEENRSSSSAPLLPWILMAVSESPVEKMIRLFWIQQELISSSEDLYQAIVKDGSSESVSYNDATLVIDKLNQWCKGKASFALPSEEQFVYLAKKLYDPAANIENPEPLVACQTLSDKELEIPTQEGGNFLIKKLLGNKWQLTQSKCERFDLASGDITCENDTYVKKGGTRHSTDATECIPEYRADSVPDVREPNTTFRLILIEEPKTESEESQ
jgi:hypothetical protein